MTWQGHLGRSLEEGLPTASVTHTRGLTFSSKRERDRAWALGIFYLEIPSHLTIDSMRQFGRELITADSPYRRTPQYGELEGFIALENNQQTKLALRRHRWDQHYPTAVAAFGRQLDDLGRAIIADVFRQSGIPESLWSRASGGYATGGGTAFLNFVHYDTRNPDLGLRPHTDYGFVTILDATAPGLQVDINGQFEDVPVLPGHFVVNFGEALHFVTACSARTVGAVVHRVLSQTSDDATRHGIVYFANPDLDGRLWQFNTEGECEGSSSVQALFARLERNLTA